VVPTLLQAGLLWAGLLRGILLLLLVLHLLGILLWEILVLACRLEGDGLVVILGAILIYCWVGQVYRVLELVARPFRLLLY